MTLELDHCFILVEAGGKIADLLVAEGFTEGPRKRHRGQGTENRCFLFSNGFLEFLWVHDADEARTGPGRDLRLADRQSEPLASPFGVVLKSEGGATPFEGWAYQPEYFQAPKAFHVGANSAHLDEPLCIFAPFMKGTGAKRLADERMKRSLTDVRICTPSNDRLCILAAAGKARRLSIVPETHHMMECTLDDGAAGCTRDFRPHIPLVLRW